MPINGFLYPGAKVVTPYEVANSLRFDGSSANLSRTKGTSDSTKIGTYSWWIKNSKFTGQNLIDCGDAFANSSSVYISSNNTLTVFSRISNSNVLVLETDREFRDPAAWHNIVVAIDTTQGTASNRVKVYVDGVQQTSFSTETYPDQNADLRFFTSSETEKISSTTYESGGYFGGYMCEVVKVDGQALAPTSFGQFNNDTPTVWEPIDVSGLTFGTNGYYLDFEKDETSTNFIDRSSNARTITAAGNVHHSLDQAKFNDSSIEFDGSGDNLQVADSSDFDFGTGDFTFELWVYKQTSGKMSVFETRTYSGSGGEGFNLEFSSADKFEWYDSSLTSGLPGDPSAISLNTWTHYAIVRYNNVCTMYKNGTSVGTPKDVGSASQNSTRGPIIGEVANGDNDFDGYMDEIRLSNVARYTGNFTAPTSPFTSDSNTVLLIQSNASNKIGADVSGQGNHFESSGITSEDQSTDTCTNNFCTWNPLDNYYPAMTFSDGNLRALTTINKYTYNSTTIGMTSGKYYCEIKCTAQSAHSSGSPQDAMVLGITSTHSGGTTQELGHNAHDWGIYANGDGTNGQYRNNDSLTNYGVTFTTGDIIGIYVDLDNNKLYFAKNGTIMQSGTGISITAPASTPRGAYFFAVNNWSSTTSGTFDANFGGTQSFTVSSGNTDPNGYGNFEYDPSAGTFDGASKNFYALNTKNLAEFG